MIESSGTKMQRRNDYVGGSGFWTGSGSHCGSDSDRGYGYGCATACSGGAWVQVSHVRTTLNAYGHAETGGAWVHHGETRACENGNVRVADGAGGWATD